MKEFAKHCLRSACFILILLTLLAAASFLFRPKGNREQDGMHTPDANGILAEPPGSIDVLFLGDSIPYLAIIPQDIWADTGITSYVCGSIAQSFYQTEEYLHQAFETQQPRLVILETNVLYTDYDRLDTPLNLAQQLLPVFRYHDRWKKLLPQDFFSGVSYNAPVAAKGYSYRKGIKPADASEHMMDLGEPEDSFPAKNLKLLRAFARYCSSHGTQLILLSVPSVANWTLSRHNYVAKVASEWDILFLDLNLMLEEVPIDWAQDSMDGGDHMNFNGARKVSDWIGQYLIQTELFSDKREDPAFAYWNEENQRFLAENSLPADAFS